ncbi:daptide biosynthesis RiPP recognition protein [Williamsia sp. MIQD14]|uniref:daptide biosynthesis RiPP recognition protein n=1 Tax=Williamsia sp. MIQD14 TaxID=3425703 RepID=UPI003DA17340
MYFTGDLTRMTPRLRTLITGIDYGSPRPAGAPPEIAVSRTAHVSDLTDVLGRAVTVFAPRDVACDLADSPTVVVDVDGDLGEMDEVYLCSDHPDGPVSVRVQDYSSSPYVSILGSTVVRVTSDSEFAEYLDDADSAAESGTFAEFLTSPAVALADLTALGFPTGPAVDGPRVRLSVSPEGDIAVSPFTTPLGTVSDFTVAGLDTAWAEGGPDGLVGAAIPLAHVVDPDLRARSVADRPWLGRYLCAVEAIRAIRSHGHDDVRVSGFGARLDSGVASDADRARGDLPVLAFTSDHAFVWQEGRLRRVSRDAGVLLENVLTSTEPVTPDADGATGRLLAAMTAVGIGFGTPTRAEASQTVGA